MTAPAPRAPRASRRRTLAALITVSLALAVTACGLGGGPPPRQFTLHPVTNFPGGLPAVKWSLVVDEPAAARQIDTSRIALMSGPFQVEYYADVEWTDNAPAMVQLLLMQSFQNTGRLPVVAPTRQTLATDFLLLSNLRKFQVARDASGTPQATVVIEPTLLRMPRRTAFATAKRQPRSMPTRLKRSQQLLMPASATRCGVWSTGHSNKAAQPGRPFSSAAETRPHARTVGRTPWRVKCSWLRANPDLSMGSAVNFRASSRRDAIAELAAGRDQFSEIGVWEPATATGEVRSDLIDLRDDIDCQGGTQASAE